MQRPEDEVIRGIRADLARSRVEVRLDGVLAWQDFLREVVLHARRPRRISQLRIDEIGRPTAPKNRAASKTEGEPGEVPVEGHRAVGFPGLTPNGAGTALAGRT